MIGRDFARARPMPGRRRFDIWQRRRISVQANPDHGALVMGKLEDCASNPAACEIGSDQLALHAAHITDLHTPCAEHGNSLRIDRVLRLGDEMNLLSRRRP